MKENRNIDSQMLQNLVSDRDDITHLWGGWDGK